MATKDSNEESNLNKGNSGEEDFGLPDINFDELEELGDEEMLSDTDGMQEEIDKARKLVEDSAEEPIASASEEVSKTNEDVKEVFSDADPSGAITEGMDPDTMSELEEAGQLLFEATLLEEDLYTENSKEDASLADFSTPSPKEETTSPPPETESVKITARDDSDSSAFGKEEDSVEIPQQVETPAKEEEPVSATTTTGLFSVDESLKTDEETSFEEPEQPVRAPEPKSYNQYGNGSSAKSSFVKVIALGVISALLFGFVFWFMSGDSKEVSKVKTKTVKKIKKNKSSTTKATSVEKKATNAGLTKETKVKAISSTNSNQVKAKIKEKLGKSKSQVSSTSKNTPSKKTVTKKSAPVTTGSGESTTISFRTGRSYIVVGSFADESVAQKYAKSLAGKGESVSVLLPIEPGIQNVRVSIADYISVSEALNYIDEYKGTYGDDIWILKH